MKFLKILFIPFQMVAVLIGLIFLGIFWGYSYGVAFITGKSINDVVKD